MQNNQAAPGIDGVIVDLVIGALNLRHGFDRLAQTARERTGADPETGGALFVFANKRATLLKALWFEKNGFCLLYKRLHQAVFVLPAAGVGSTSVHIDAPSLAKLLMGVPKDEAPSRKA